MSALELVNVHKRFGAVETLKGIDLSLASGEFLVLLGPSGCGKSTLLNIIAGLAEATGGDVRIGNRSVTGVHPKNRDIAMVFQSYALYPNMSVARNIGFGLEMRNVPAAERKQAVEKAAKILQIENLLDRKPSELSGGQRQRVAIGRALVRDPQIFLFDEPLSNLDAKLRMEMRTELKRLHQMLGTTIVYVTHDQIEAMTLATRIAVMRNGQIEQLATPDEIYNRPATRYVASFVGSPPMNMLDARVADGVAYVDGSPGGIPLPREFRDNAASARDVIIGIRPESLTLASRDGGLAIEAEVDVVELTGPELVVTSTIGNQRLTASLPPKTRIAVGATQRFDVDASALHIFDKATGQRIQRVSGAG
ncbi:ABC transporter ATP-binding protein [Phyllobacterium endophyticum]|uniref:Sugar ABC transporter ATP-binding protein n=1 Tax=Phyllobacterium endophyticum TaxID=1149773 RepID=A0A2P7APC2_9HYPH|nr:sn-glycerol-3-phosphate ABC transporter ATP-binding protein UgpC [Phyllobacterium endophyticum]MBB3233569.1 multiple sugar transport system ATP-binding protein [Phyllobacterium endophyticum]PSH56059.1 sugar ABC transporter ATP-binding protein [Phyllobacterium endophyticum]TYR41211.1 sn-glycerol-3-phosphate ABC transporter ATP-binding protein UgpC [Phyllobacterium endophyticum]